ncbi:MAG TPA: Wzz/FepE/Etk N-terminal domain-containing protein [Dehalococcoidia bacterium]|nr:Wzz/FepE/Etk N-terminal domain-containing protein [Dehalococcoidia bacterium]
MPEQTRLALYKYLAILARRKWVILTPVVVGVLGAVAATFWLPQAMPRTYEATATAQLAVAGRSEKGLSDINKEQADRLTNTFVYVLQGPDVLSDVIADLGLDATPSDLKSRLTFEPVAGTELVEIKARAPSPEEARDIANAMATAWREQGSAFYAILDTPELSRSFTVAEEASLPASPIEPDWQQRVGLGLLMGLVAGTLLALAIEYTDRTINSPSDLRDLVEVPVLSHLPRVPKLLGSTRRRIAELDVPPYQYTFDSGELRLLTIKLLHTLQDQHLNSLFVTSTWPSEGTTTVAIGVAMGLARSGVEVLLIDANLSRPALHTAFGGIPEAPGLTDVLLSMGEDEPPQALLRKTIHEPPVDGLSVLTAGSPHADSWNILGSGEMRKLVESYAGTDTVLVIDGPPVLSSVDALGAAAMAAGVVLVCAEGKTSVDDVQRGLSQLALLGANVLGLVYNQARTPIGTIARSAAAV